MARQNYASLQAKINKEIERLQKQAQVLQSKSRKPVLNSIIRSMKEYGITPEEVGAAFGKAPGSAKSASPKTPKASKAASTKKPVPAKYRHPDSGSTWTGRGKAPLWIVEAEKNGQARQQFLI